MRILSSRNPNSYRSVIDAMIAAMTPPRAIPPYPPKTYPIGIQTATMKRFPIGCLNLFLKNQLRTIPVTPSPNAIKAAGMIAIHGVSKIIQRKNIDIPHIKQKFTSLKSRFDWNQ